MIVFERFILRGNIDIYEFCKQKEISNDEDLKSYCVERNMTIPIKKYFEISESKLEQKNIPATKNIKSKPIKEEEDLSSEVKKEESKPQKPARKPRTRRTKKQSK